MVPLEHRALLIKKSLELCIKVNEEIVPDSKQQAKDRIEASKFMVEAQTEMFQLLRDGPGLTNN